MIRQPRALTHAQFATDTPIGSTQPSIGMHTLGLTTSTPKGVRPITQLDANTLAFSVDTRCSEMISSAARCDRACLDGDDVRTEGSRSHTNIALGVE